jgi:formyl-CoA transferase
MQLTRTPSTVARSAPKRGEHSEEILKEIGLEAAELSSLKAKGVY